MNTLERPLCVDCDGTLLATDLLHESFFLLLKQRPWALLLIPIWLLKGKVNLKNKIAENVVFNWATLPYRKEVLELIDFAAKEGRQVNLVTASPITWARGIADYLNCFDLVIATNEITNLSGKNKALKLNQLFGKGCYDYVGDAYIDFNVWSDCYESVIATSNSSLIKRARVNLENVKVVLLKGPNLYTYFKALRIHQWLKNLLVFVPVMAAHKFDYISMFEAFSAFVAFSLCASAVYILNDLLDLESDRQHIRKCKRAFASGNIPIWHGVILMPLLLLISAYISLNLSLSFFTVLAGYFCITLVYSFVLKKQVIVDVMLLAGLYTIRIVAGAVATKTVPSFWLLAFSIFIFLSLAIVKRYSELKVTLLENKTETAGRGYTVKDLPVLVAIGVASGIGSIQIFALYLNNPETSVLYPSFYWLWIAPSVLLYWISRVWMKSHRGELDDDPVVFAARDWQSILILIVLLFSFVMATN